MITIALTEEVRKALRLASTDFEHEISALISSCKLDLIDAGLDEKTVNSEQDELVNTAIIVFCKAMFGIDNPNQKQYLSIYKSMKISLKNANHKGSDESE